MNSFLQSIADFFTNLFSTVKTFLEPFVNQFLTNAGAIVLATAEKFVLQVATDPSLVTDDQKRQAAFNGILSDLKAQGIAVGTAIVNSAIEAAVAKMKADIVKAQATAVSQSSGPVASQ